jgi:hypothetical protein
MLATASGMGLLLGLGCGWRRGGGSWRSDRRLGRWGRCVRAANCGNFGSGHLVALGNELYVEDELCLGGDDGWAASVAVA